MAEPDRIKTQSCGVHLEIGVLQSILVLEQVLVHPPEVGLSGCSFGGRRGGSSVWMDLLKRKMPKHKPQGAGKVPLKGAKAVAVVVSGGNVSTETAAAILARR